MSPLKTLRLGPNLNKKEQELEALALPVQARAKTLLDEHTKLLRAEHARQREQADQEAPMEGEEGSEAEDLSPQQLKVDSDDVRREKRG
jgi:hypothetical protein